MPELTLLRDLSVVMVAAAGMTFLCHVLKQPVVIGYLLAGLIIGPHTPPFSLINDAHSIETMAELGLVFLMFAVGLEFNLPKLRRVGVPAALAATFEVLGMVGVGYALGIAFGWSRLDSFYLGAILSISSTTIIIKVFGDLKLIKEEFAQAVFGILILEDVVAIILLTILTGLGTSQIEGSAAVRAFAEVSFFVVLFLVIGLALVPRLIGWIGKFRSKELLGIGILGLCLASALLASQLGFSIALGAFLMGSIVGVSSEIDAVEEWFHPIRDMFSAIFFVATGMMINPGLLWDYKIAVILIVLTTIIAKVMTGAAGSFLAGYSLKTSFKVGMSLAQIGEFSFVFAALALKDPRASSFLYPLAVCVSALTTLSTPYLIRSSDNVVSGLLRTIGPAMTQSLNRYHHWITAWRERGSTQGGVISRYLVRLAIYASLLTAGQWVFTFFTTQLVDERLFQFTAWSVGFLVCLPLMNAVATYATHFILLVLTESLVRLHWFKILERFSIHRFYDAVHAAIISMLALIFFFRAGDRLPKDDQMWVVACGTVLIALLMRPKISASYNHMESVLDEALGLATSEPLRQAALATDEGDGALSGSMERIFITRRDAAVHQSIRSMGLREKTGASLIALYHRGTLITNPPPQTVLSEKDTLVILGSPDERKKARLLFKTGNC